MENVQIISGKTVAFISIALCVFAAGAVGAYYYWQQTTEETSATVVTDATLTGTVVYRERVPLPAGSSLVVQLLDVTDIGVEPLLIAEQTIITRGENVPLSFAIPYMQSQIQSDRKYAIEASILGEGDLYFATPELTPVLTANNPTSNIDLLLTQNGVATVVNEDGTVSAPTLSGTSWRWVRSEVSATTSPAAPSSNEYILTFREEGTFNSTTDCNRIAGAYVVNGQSLSLNSISMTEMACPDSVDTEYAAELGRVASFSISGNELRITLQPDNAVMVFEKQVTETPEAPTPSPDEVVTPDTPVGDDADAVMCTMDAKQCPDGSFVGRVPPSCAFAACPGE